MGEARTKSMRVRVTTEERALIDSRATDAGYGSASEFVRALALGLGAAAPGESPASSTAGAPAPTPSPADELAARFAARFAELRRNYPIVVARRMANREIYGGSG